MTVEELRDNLINVLSEVWGGSNAAACSAVAVDNLIAAAKEEERGKIRRWIEEDAPISDDGVPYSSLLSYLAPKEDEQDNTTEEEYEDMRRNGGPGVKP